MRLQGRVALALALAALAVPAGTASAAPSAYLGAAEEGVQRIGQIWWNPVAGWYTTYPYRPSEGAGGLATLWDVFPLLETRALVALADPTPANRAVLERDARGAERYWNPDLRPVGGYSFLPDLRGRRTNAFFDDNGWFGLAFLDAYRATHDPRLLTDAIRAFRFIQLAGWARDSGGGVWWDTMHEKKTVEPLAAEVLLGALLYEQTHVRGYLNVARSYLDWADRHSWNPQRRLYQRNESDPTTMDYVQGMIAGGEAVLCRSLHVALYCRRADALVQAAAAAFPPSYHWAPETDAIYLRWLLELWTTDHDPLSYQLAAAAGQEALQNARDAAGLWTLSWTGGYASEHRLLTDAGTLMLFAALAGAPAPAAG